MYRNRLTIAQFDVARSSREGTMPCRLGLRTCVNTLEIAAKVNASPDPTSAILTVRESDRNFKP
jgi:hypothetical protein